VSCRVRVVHVLPNMACAACGSTCNDVAQPPQATQPCVHVQGEGGYMRVSRSPNDCGVSAEPVYIDLKPGSTA
jgi:hypothetical protein